MSKPGIRIYHNPRCSKSRQCLEIIRKAGVEPEIVEYLKAPPSVKGLGAIVKMLKMKPLDIVRKKEKKFKDLGLDKQVPADPQLLKILHENPVLIERPIVVKGTKAIMGRPPENVKALL